MTDTRKHSRITRRHHKVDRLPPHILDQLRERVQRGESYEAVEAWLDGQGFKVGHSSIHRWHKFLREGLPRLDERARLAEMIVSATSVDPSTVQNAAYQLVMQQTLDLLMAVDSGEALPPKDLAKIMGSLARLGGTATSLTKSLDERRQRQIAGANKKIEAMARDGTLPASAVETIKRLYGLQTVEPPDAAKANG